MNRADEVQKIIEGFQSESRLRQAKIWQALEYVGIFLVFVVFTGLAYLQYMAGSVNRALVVEGLGVLFVVSGLWSIHKNPQKYMEAVRPPSSKERVRRWTIVIIIFVGSFFLQKWL